MRRAAIYNNGIFAGILTEENTSTGVSYVFHYDEIYYKDDSKHAISLTLPKTKPEHRNEKMFPFFSNMISEGVNLEIQTRYLR